MQTTATNPTSGASQGRPTTHNAYLNILAELGGPGLLLFAGFLASAWLMLRRRHRSDPALDTLTSAVAAGFLIAVVGSLFLTEQFYPPLWFMAALGAGLVRPAAVAAPAFRRQHA